MRKKSDKEVRFCVVCGDKAKGLNFNALTCQSCKAFFRRNALSKKELKCSFENSCIINVITRKFCSCCRLKKCFEKGMRKEWILTEEEKRLIREKILQNRLRKQQIQSDSKTILNHDESGPCRELSVSPAHSLGNRSNSTTSTIVSIKFDDNDEDDQINAVSSTSLNSGLDLVQQFDQYNSIQSTNQQNKNDNNLNVLYSSNDPNLYYQHFHQANQGDDFEQSSLSIQNPARLFSSNSEFKVENDFDIINETVSQTTFDAFENNNFIIPSSSSSSSSSPSKMNFESKLKQDNSCSSNNQDDYLRNYLHDFTNHLPPFFNIDPMNEFASKLDQNIFTINDGSSFFSVKEKCLLQELCSACTLLHNPYKRLLIVKQMHQIKEHQCTVVDSFIHRLICMSKRLSPFNSLTLDDQVQLLKCGLIEMLSIRSILIFDPDPGAWTFMDDNCKLSIMAFMDAIQPCCLKYDYRISVKNYYTNFKHEWKNDYIIFDLLTAIILFTERPGIIAKEKIREEKQTYCELLKHYLEMKYPTSAEAHCSYDRLSLLAKAMQVLHEDIIHVYVNVIGSTCSPLFLQLIAEHPKQTPHEIDEQAN